MGIRLIPKLDIKGPNLVKGVHLEGLRVLGKPEDFAYKYYQDGADELIYLDLVASLYGRSNLLEIVERTASKIFIPLTVGGGIRSLDDMRSLLRAGADKIAVNTALFETPELITEGARLFGSQCMVLYVEAKKKPDGTWHCMHTNARETSGREVLDWVTEMVDRGAGEILLTSVDNEGTGHGFDLELTRMISDAVPVPVIANGGAGTTEHFQQAAEAVGCGGIAASSVFHYHRLQQLEDTQAYSQEGNTSFIELTRSGTTQFLEDRIHPTDVRVTKAALAGISDCRVLDSDAVTPPVSGGIPKVTVIDYGMGNLFSLARALRHLGADVTFTEDPAVAALADRLVLPGVGAFGDAMKNLRERGLVGVLRGHAEASKPLLGICLGMQLLMSKSLEFGEHEGLGIIGGSVKRLFGAGECPEGWKLPHIGWNTIAPSAEKAWDPTVLAQFPESGYVYFVHSYAGFPEADEHVLSTTQYAGFSFTSAIMKNNVVGCQFHPELSGEAGLTILKQFLTLT